MKKAEIIRTMRDYRAAIQEAQGLRRIRDAVAADPDYWLPWRAEDADRLEELERQMADAWDVVQDVIDGIRGDWEGIPMAAWVRYYYTGDDSCIPAGTTVSTSTDSYEARERAMLEAIGRVRLHC